MKKDSRSLKKEFFSLSVKPDWQCVQNEKHAVIYNITPIVANWKQPNWNRSIVAGGTNQIPKIGKTK